MSLKNKKGFTLIEMLAVVVIIGIITGISLPLIKRLQDMNEQKKYRAYSDGMKYGAKLYMNSNEVDLFGDAGSGCAIIGFKEMNEKGLLKDIAIDGVTCNDKNTFARVVKVNDHYGYSMSIKCVKKDNPSSTVYSENLNLSNQCEYANGRIIDLIIEPEKTTTYKQSVDIDIKLKSVTGIYPKNVSLQYAFSQTQDESGIIGTWSPLKIDVKGEEEQYQIIENGNAVETITTVQTPKGYTGDVYILVKVLYLRDLLDRDWYGYVDEADINDTIVGGKYLLDNEKPTASTRSENGVVASQTVTLTMTDNKALKKYYFGTTNPETNSNLAYTTISGTSRTETTTVSTGAKYYLRVCDAANNCVDTNNVFYKTTLNANNGTVTPASVVTLSGNSFSLPTPTRIGYTFNGWFTAASGGTKVGNGGVSYAPTDNKTLYAQWTANSYGVTLDGQGATAPGSTGVTATYASDMPAITVPARKYTVTYNANGGSVNPASATATYTFGGYYTETDGKGTQYYTANGSSARKWDKTASSTLYAKWTSASVTLPTPTRTGYTFAGWYTAASGGNKIGNAGAAYTPTSTLTIFAHWTPNTYAVTLDRQNGSGGTGNVTATYDAAMPTITKPTRTYGISYNANGGSVSPTSATATYTFAGYFAASNGTGTQYYKADGTSNHAWDKAGTATIYAKWTGGSVTLPTPTRTGYTFGGWYTAASGGSKIGNGGASYTATAAITMYAHWTANTYTVTLDQQGGSGGTGSVTATYAAAMPGITKPTRAYKVTYNANGGSVGTASATATYTFGGYYTSTGGSGTQYYTATPGSARNWDKTAATTLYAKWTSASVTLPTPSRSGYIFNGWYTATSGGTKIGNAGAVYTPTAAVTLYAHWTASGPASFATDDCDIMVAAIKSGNTSKYNVGDVRTINMGSFGNQKIRIANKSNASCSLASKTACGFVIEFVDIVTRHTYNDAATNVGGWPSSGIRSYLNSTFYNAIPQCIRNGIINTTVVSGHEYNAYSNYTSTDKVYLLATAEVKPYEFTCVTLHNGIGGSAAQTRVLDYYTSRGTDFGNLIKKYNGEAMSWWNRSANSCDGWRVDYGAFRLITGSGEHGSTGAQSNDGVSPAFRMG